MVGLYADMFGTVLGVRIKDQHGYLVARGESLMFGTGVLMYLLGVCKWGGQNYLVSEISRSQMCYLWSEIRGRRDYLGSDVSSASLFKPFSWYQVFLNLDSRLSGVFEQAGLIISGSEKIARHQHPVPKVKEFSPGPGSRFFRSYRHPTMIGP